MVLSESLKSGVLSLYQPKFRIQNDSGLSFHSDYYIIFGRLCIIHIRQIQLYTMIFAKVPTGPVCLSGASNSKEVSEEDAEHVET